MYICSSNLWLATQAWCHTHATFLCQANEIEEYLQGALNIYLTMISVTHMVFNQHERHVFE